jgi:hypothetical protein
MKDGSRREAHSSEMPRELIFQTRARSLDVFEARLSRLGATAGTVRELGERLFAGLEGAESTAIGKVVSEVIELTR